MSEQLTDELAREIAARHIARLRRAHVACRFASSRRPAELARSYDTIVIDSPRFHSISNVSIHSQAAQAICDTLLVLRAVAHCPRFALRENASFWWDLIQEPDELVPQLFNCFTTRATTRVFPRIVFSGLLLRSYTPPLDSILLSSLTNEECAVSEEAKSDISILKNYSNEPKEPIEWVVHMRFEPNISSTKTVLEVISRYARTAISSDTSPFRWVGIMLLGKVVDMYTKRGIELVQMRAVNDLCAAVPDSIQVEVRFPFSFRGSSYPQRHTVMESHHLQPYLRHAYGFHGSPFTGRMQVLDLVNAFQGTNRGFEPNIVSVCTMIPFMTSLRELRMCVNQTADLVWLAYALFHPRSKISKWKSLIQSGKRQSEHPRFAPQPIQDVDWSVLTTVANSSNLLATVLLLTRPSMDPSKMTDSRQIRTASIVKRAQVYSSRNKQLTALTPGTLVEVCVIKPPANELIPDATIVMVPGFGFGTVSASYLKNEVRIPVPEHPKTKISALQLENLEIPEVSRRSTKIVQPNDQALLLTCINVV